MSIKCDLCEGNNIEYKFKVQNYSIHQCLNCELSFIHPKPEKGKFPIVPFHMSIEIAELYLADILKYTGSTNLRLLEIGGIHINFLKLAQNKGFQVAAIDENKDSVSKANQKLGDESAMCGDLDSIDSEKIGKFDVCIVFSGIDHIRNINAFIIQIKDMLNDNGILLMNTPSFDKWDTNLLKNKETEFTPEHLFYFNTQNLESFLIKSGFTDLTTTEVNESSNNGKPSKIETICRKRNIPHTTQKLSIIMPVYNEKQSFRETVEIVLNKQIDGVEKELIIIESNSTDGTREEVRKYENHEIVTVIYEEKPMGKGHAVRAGLKHATGDIILFQDADQEYDVNDYEALLEPILKYQKMFTLGSRHSGNWKMRSFEDKKFLGEILNFAHIIFTWMINVFCGSNLKDPFTMYKVFRKECLYGLEFDANRFDFDWELVIKFLRKKYFPIEIPVNYKSRSFSEGKKVSLFKDPISWMIALFKYRFCELRPSKNKS